MVKSNSESKDSAVSSATNVLSQYVKTLSSRDTAFKANRVILLGRPGAGKTVTALSISEKFTLEAEEWTTLDDVFVLQFDGDGLLSAYGHKLEVPHADLSGVPGKYLSKAIAAVFKETIVPGVNSGKIKALIPDSLSSLDAMYKTHLSSTLEGQDLWTALLTKHKDFADKCRELSCDLICISHGKAVSAARSTKDDVISEHEAKLIASGLEVGSVRMDITGQGAEWYRRNFSNIWPVKAKGPGHNRSYSLYPYGTEGFEWKCRLKGLKKEEPCNLREIFARARGEAKSS